MEEWIDLYRRDGSSLGRRIPKSAPRAADEYYLHVHVLLCSEAGGWLLQQRSMAKQFSPGKWDATGGGVMAGETSRDAAFREVREELGLRIPPDRLCFAARQIVEEAGRCILDIWYARMDFRAEDCVLQAGEVDGVRLVPFAELAEACRDKGPAYREVLEKIRALCDAV